MLRRRRQQPQAQSAAQWREYSHQRHAYPSRGYRLPFPRLVSTLPTRPARTASPQRCAWLCDSAPLRSRARWWHTRDRPHLLRDCPVAPASCCVLHATRHSSRGSHLQEAPLRRTKPQLLRRAARTLRRATRTLRHATHARYNAQHAHCNVQHGAGLARGGRTSGRWTATCMVLSRRASW